jgi:hypothetical protein
MHLMQNVPTLNAKKFAKQRPNTRMIHPSSKKLSGTIETFNSNDENTHEIRSTDGPLRLSPSEFHPKFE